MAINIDEKISGQVKPVADRLKEVNFLLMAVVIVLFVGFAGCFIAATAMLVDAFNSKTTSYQALTDQIQIQSTKIDSLVQKAAKK